MAERLGLPTDEEVDKMKLGKLTRLLHELGMKEDQTDEIEKEEARAELKRMIREVQKAAATKRRPGQITEMLQQAILENRTKREGLTQICNSILRFVASMDDDDQQKMKKFFGQDLQVALADVGSFLQNNDCPILVVGETSSGKSSLLNLLLGEDILPVSHLACTSTLCFVRYGKVKKATVYLKGRGPTAGTRQRTIDLQDADRTTKAGLASYVHRWGRQDAEEVEKVVIEWPLQFLQGGICLVDGPGIKTKKKMDEVVAGALPSTCAFIYVINSANAPLPAPSSSGDEEGADEHTDGLSILLELCQRQKWGNMSQFDLESTMFVCNRWDCVQHNVNGEEVVKNDYLGLLKSHFPELRDDQVFFLSCIKAVGPAGQLSPEFTRLLDGLDVLLPQSLQHKLELQYHHVHQVFLKASQYIRLKLYSAYGTQEERRDAMEGARKRLINFNDHANEVLRTLDQMLTATKKEAGGLLRAFLRNEALKSSVYQKVLDDFPAVDNSEIGSARLIAAIADEVESQLKSSPRASAFNQCVRDADIRLREEFQTQFGGLLEQHNDVIEEMLRIPLLSLDEHLGMIFKQVFFTIAGFFNAAYLLAMIVDPILGSTIWATVDLAQNLIKIVLRPDNREEYVRRFTNLVFDAMTKEAAIESAVEKHLKRPIQYLKACKVAIPDLRRVDELLIQDAETEKRTKEQIANIYKPRYEEVCRLAEDLYSFYVIYIKKHELDFRDLSDWNPHNEGAYGKVHKVQVSKDGVTFPAAVKILRHLPSEETAANFVREAENLRKLKGRHIVDFFGTYCDGTARDNAGNPKAGLVMEYCPSTLDKKLFERRENSPAWWGADPERQAAAFRYTQNLAVQLCEGLKHIHDAGYMHRDLKLINVLVSSEGVVKLADLGSSKSEEAYARTKDGTRFYAAPEVLAQKEYNRSADIYSLGLILLEMWYGRTIYFPDDPDYESQLNRALPLNLDQELPLPSWNGRAPPIPEWWKLINDCLRRNTGKRPTAENCRNRIAGMSLEPARGPSGARAASEVRIDIQE
ncbi:NEK7 [Branchiostoma lanceolatum]|uniref:NEK7 protein n=1 Tax=Branchiostoma lanceolatum TaxID=7740 RepID=A0A8J9ZD00_BRALA|nr:NEK7 [Branchiostoma lanceolatum]